MPSWNPRLLFFPLWTILLLVFSCGGSDSPDVGRRPNVLLILVDDLGPECLGSYGGRSYRTPNIDALAASGLRFERAFATPLCTPSRVQLLTGKYPFRTGWDNWINRRDRSEQRFETHWPNLASTLKGAGYKTCVTGKWQLARFDDDPDHPRECGFDEYCLWTWSHGASERVSRYWHPSVWENGKLLEGTEGRFGPDIYSRYLIDFMRRNRDEPFFAYYSMALTHPPFVPPPGLEGDKAGVSDGPLVPPYFSAMVEYTDRLVGDIVRTLDDLGIREDTLILLTSDNGTSQKIISDLGGEPFRGGKWTIAGTWIPFIANWKGTIREGAETRELLDFTDVLPTVADLAGVSLPSGSVFDGESFLPFLRGDSTGPRQWIFSYTDGHWFIRDEDDYQLDDRGGFFKIVQRYRLEPVAEESSDRRDRLDATAKTLLASDGDESR